MLANRPGLITNNNSEYFFPPGNVGDFNGSNEYLYTSDHSDFQGSAYSLDAWVYVRDTGSCGILSQNTSASTPRWQFHVVGFVPKLQYNSGSWAERICSSTVNINNWTHIGVTCNGSNVKFYIDGVVTDTLSALSIGDAPHPLRIGFVYTSEYANYKIRNIRMIIGMALDYTKIPKTLQDYQTDAGSLNGTTEKEVLRVMFDGFAEGDLPASWTEQSEHGNWDPVEEEFLGHTMYRQNTPECVHDPGVR